LSGEGAAECGLIGVVGWFGLCVEGTKVGCAARYGEHLGSGDVERRCCGGASALFGN